MRRSIWLCIQCLLWCWPILANAGSMPQVTPPLWTLTRPLADLQVFVLPADVLQLQLNSTMAYLLDGTRIQTNANHYSLLSGLTDCLQLDVSLATRQRGLTAPLVLHEQTIGLRYALAPYGAFWGNPTLALQWSRYNQAVPWIGLSLTVGDEAFHAWLWAMQWQWQQALHRHWGTAQGQWKISISKIIASTGWTLGVHTDVQWQWEKSLGIRSQQQLLSLGSMAQWSPDTPWYVAASVMLQRETRQDSSVMIPTWSVVSWLLFGWSI